MAPESDVVLVQIAEKVEHLMCQCNINRDL